MLIEFEELVVPLHLRAIERLSPELRKEISFEIYTKEEVNRLGNLDALSKLVGNYAETPVPVCPYPEILISNYIPAQIIHENNSGDYLLTFSPDCIIPINFYETIFENLRSGSEDLLFACPRTEATSILPHLSSTDSFTNNELLQIGLENLHWTYKHVFAYAEDFAYWASTIWWKTQYSYLSRCFHLQPLVIKLNGKKFPGGKDKPISSTDGYFTENLDISRIKILQPTELAVFEFSDSTKQIALTGKSIDGNNLRHFIEKNITERQRYWFNQPIWFGPEDHDPSYEILSLVNSTKNLHKAPV
jgi:hypothetical protein